MINNNYTSKFDDMIWATQVDDTFPLELLKENPNWHMPRTIFEKYQLTIPYNAFYFCLWSTGTREENQEFWWKTGEEINFIDDKTTDLLETQNSNLIVRRSRQLKYKNVTLIPQIILELRHVLPFKYMYININYLFWVYQIDWMRRGCPIWVRRSTTMNCTLILLIRLLLWSYRTGRSSSVMWF